MGFSKKHQLIEVVKKESEGKKWVIAGIAIRSPLKPILTKARDDGTEDEGGACSTTPTARESKIPEILSCPPAPRKRRPTTSTTCHINGAIEFFIPPDLESVFKCHAERAN